MSDKVKLGRVFIVANRDKKAAACAQYHALQVESNDGGGEECLLFTAKELESLPVVDTGLNLRDGRLYPFSDGAFHGYIVRTTEKYGDRWLAVIRKLSMRRYLHARERSGRNPEDVTRKSWLTDLLD